MGSIPPALLPSHRHTAARVPWQVRRRPKVCLRTPSTAPGRRTRTARQVRPAVSRPLYPPRRHLQPSLGRIRGRPGYLSLTRDSAHNNKQKLLTLSLDEFLRPFLLHLLPKGFVRIRHFGFLANRRRAALLPLCFTALHAAPPQAESKTSTAPILHPLWCCPKCGEPMAVVERFTAAQLQLRSPPLLATAA